MVIIGVEGGLNIGSTKMTESQRSNLDLPCAHSIPNWALASPSWLTQNAEHQYKRTNTSQWSGAKTPIEAYIGSEISCHMHKNQTHDF